MRNIAKILCLLFLIVSPTFAAYGLPPADQALNIEPSIDQPFTFTNLFGFFDTDQQYLTGNWGGLRDKLSGKGVDINMTYAGDFLNNVTGGKACGFNYNDSTGLDFNFDMEKMKGWQGLQFHVSGLYRQGKNISQRLIGNAFVASSLYGQQQLRLYGLYAQKSLFKDSLNIRLGRISAGDDFASSPLYQVYVNNSIDGNPISFPINLTSSTYPNAQWGVRAKFRPVNSFMWMGGVYNADGRVGRNEAHGADFTIKARRGILFIQEFSYLSNQKGMPDELPGNYKAGFYYNSGYFKDYYKDDNGNSYAISGLSQKKHHGNYGMYVHMDQMVYRKPNGKDGQGLTPFVVVTLAPSDTNQFPFFIDGGLVYKGLIPKRASDVTAIGIAYGQYSRQLSKYQQDSGIAQQKYEMMVEATYKIMVTKWFYLQPDVQYIMNPNGGNQNNSDALVVGTRVGLTF